MNKQYFVTLLFSMFFCLCSSVVVFASGEHDDTKELIVGMELQFPPFETTDTSGKPSGWSVDFARALAKHLDLELKIKNIAYTGLIPAVQTGIVDIVISSMSETAERKKNIDFTISYGTWYLVSLLNINSTISSFLQLNNKVYTIAVKIGTTAEVVVSEKLPKARVKKFDTWDAAVLEVAQGRATAALYDPISVYNAHKKYSQMTIPLYQPIEGFSSSIAGAMKKGNDDLREKINAFITKAKQDGTIINISKKYLEEMNKKIKAQGAPAFFE